MNEMRTYIYISSLGLNIIINKLALEKLILSVELKIVG
jgi:hypothetical protein